MPTPLVLGSARPGGAINFRYDEFPGWDRANSTQLGRLDRLVRTILQPARSALGVPVVVTSWLRAPDGRSAHGDGAALDLVAGSPVSKEATYQLWLWIARNLARAASPLVGEAIYEQPKTGLTGHAHVTLPGFGGWGQVLYQTPAGTLVELDPFTFTPTGSSSTPAPGEPGSEGDPYQLPGIIVTVDRGQRTSWLVGAAVALVVLWALAGDSL